MRLDLVHDIQRAYRAVLGCAAEPGSAGDLGPLVDRLDIECPANKAFLLLALTLLDADSSLAVVPDPQGETAAFIARMTYARIAAPDRAAFLFVPADPSLDADGLAETVLGACRGTLADPHRGATLVLETARPFGQGPETTWLLSGPGLREPFALRLPADDGGRAHAAMEARAEACAEFPLGIDIAFVDSNARLVYLPRSTSAAEA